MVMEHLGSERFSLLDTGDDASVWTQSDIEVHVLLYQLQERDWLA